MSFPIIKGFPDGTFRPSQRVTREQAISMIVDAINTITPVDLNAKPTNPVRPFTDVPSDRWSAPKITWHSGILHPQGHQQEHFVRKSILLVLN